MNLKRTIIILAGCLFMLTACNNKSAESVLEPKGEQNPELTKLRADPPVDQEPANRVKQMLSGHDAVKSVRSVNHDDHLLVGVQLNHPDRFQMHEIERDLQQQIDKDSPDLQVKLSADEKIHLEVKRLEQDLQNKQLSKKELKKRIKEIKDLSEEKT